MSNEEKLINIFREMAILHHMRGEYFPARAYERAIEENLEGVGAGLASKIEEFRQTGKIHEYEQLKKKYPIDLLALASLEGIGPKKIKVLYEKLGIKTISDLRKAAQAGKVSGLSGFGLKTEEKILKSIAFAQSNSTRVLLGSALPIARRIAAELRKLPGIVRAEYAGSIRRMQETIGDLDLLIASENPDCAKDFFSHFASSIKQNVRVVPPESFGTAWQYFTGDKNHNIELRKIAIRKGYKLNEYGLWRGGKMIAGETEKEIYEKLGFDYIEPELRTSSGELTNALPDLIGYGDLKGDLQTQSDWTDGKDSIEALAKKAIQLGHQYIAITDHTRALAMTGGSDEAKLKRQMAEIDHLQKKFHDIKILKGAEVNIMKDGTLDINDETLAQLDVVGVAVHSLFRMPKAEMTARIIRAIENPHADILFHPTGRLVQRREPYEVDMDEIIKAAKRTGTVLEIDAHPYRLDLKDEHIRKAVKAGVKLAIDSDAHNTSEMEYLEYGIGQARRGWATKEDVINTKSVEEMLQSLK